MNKVGPISITSITPSTASIGSTITIKGTCLDPFDLNDEGNYWLTHSHVRVYVSKLGSQAMSPILWEGGSQGGNTSTVNSITMRR